MSKTNKPLLAYHVGEGSEGEQVIVFATSSAAGRRKGGNELDLMFEEVEFCRRAPWADQYAGQPFIPAKAYHDAGWRLDCDHCGTQLYDDAEDDDGNPLQIVYDGRHAYCDSGCKAMREQEVARYNAAGQAFKEKVMAARPDLTFTDWIIGWPRITQCAKFTFPGGKYGGSVRDQEGDGNLSWYIAQGDQAAWDSYESVRASAAKQGEAVEVRGLQWLDTGHYRKRPPQFGYNPHDWNPLMTVAQHNRILAARVPAGCKVVQVELLERLEHVTRTLVPHLQCHVDLRALLASTEGVKNE